MHLTLYSPLSPKAILDHICYDQPVQIGSHQYKSVIQKNMFTLTIAQEYKLFDFSIENKRMHLPHDFKCAITPKESGSEISIKSEASGKFYLYACMVIIWIAVVIGLGITRENFYPFLFFALFVFILFSSFVIYFNNKEYKAFEEDITWELEGKVIAREKTYL